MMGRVDMSSSNESARNATPSSRPSPIEGEGAESGGQPSFQPFLPSWERAGVMGKADAEGERKVISVLFTDVVNYTYLSEKLDLEVVREIMNSHFKILMEAVKKYQGTV